MCLSTNLIQILLIFILSIFQNNESNFHYINMASVPPLDTDEVKKKICFAFCFYFILKVSQGLSHLLLSK